MREDDIRDLLADHALGLLEPDEAARVNAALATSPDLRAEAEALRGALYAVPLALEPEPLAPGAWQALVTRVRAGIDGSEADTPSVGRRAAAEPAAQAGTAQAGTARAGTARAGGAQAVGPQHAGARSPAGHARLGAAPRPRRPAGALAVALAAAVVLLALSIGWGAEQTRRAALKAHEQAVVAYWMRYPGMHVVPMRTVSASVPGVPPGVVCVLPDGRALVLQPHPAPGNGSYVLYGDTGTGRVELGRTRGTLIEFRSDGLKGVEVAVPGSRGGVVARAVLQ